MKSSLAIVLVGATLMGYHTAALSIGGNELLQSCELLLRDAKQIEDKLAVPVGGRMCLFYIEALRDSVALNDAEGRPLMRVCSPTQSSTWEFVGIFVQFARKNPSVLDQSGAEITHAALAELFPCAR
jgi:hypothetical protein